MAQNVDIVFLGGCVVDLISVFSSYSSRLAKPGESLAGNRFTKGFGGNGVNQSVMATRLGASSALIAKVGDDSFGEDCIQNILENGINADFVTKTSASTTSTACVFITDEGTNSIIYVPGATLYLTPDDVKQATALIIYARVLLCSFEAPLDALSEALSIARKYKVLTILNASPTRTGDFESLFALADILCINEQEAAEASGMPVVNLENVHLALQILFKKQCTTVIITLGSQGVVFQSIEQPKYTHIPVRSVIAVDTIGAGDAFLGTLAYFLAKVPSLCFQEKVCRASEVATLSVLKPGTQPSYPYPKDLPEGFLTATECALNL